ncbi:MAG: 3-oxoacyl-ACP reductase [Frankiales bacterium]|nr:3-oxoacyl-ACP reductase [Frankiales bacterium]
MPSTPHTSVLLIGASRGLGLAISRQYLRNGAHVVATVRGAVRTALHDVRDEFAGQLEIEHVDITIPNEVRGLRDRLANRRFELLFVNAGITNAEDETPRDVTVGDFSSLMITNALSPMRAVEELQPLVTQTGTVAVMSSGQGSIANNTRGGFELYRASKSALNQLMRSYAARSSGDPRTLLLMAPGWVKTDLGGPNAKLTIDESIPHLVKTVDDQHGHGGLQFLDYLGRTVPW